MDKFTITFKEEAEELLTELETDLLEWQTAPDDSARIDNIFRIVHTIKGSGSMFGFEELVRFAHQFESALDAIRDGRCKVSSEFIELSLGVCDHFRHMIEGDNPDGCFSDDIIASLHRLIPPSVLYPEGLSSHFPSHISSYDPNTGTMLCAASSEEKNRGGDDTRPADTPRRVVIEFTPFPEIFESGSNPLLLLEEAHRLGDCRAFPEVDHLPALEDLDPERCYLRWDLEIMTSQPLARIRDIFIFVEDLCRLRISEADTPPSDPVHGTLSFHPAAGGADSRTDSRQSRSPGINDPECRDLPAVSREVRQARESRLRVSSRKLDFLVDLVGELVTVQAGIARKAHDAGDAEGTILSENLEQLVTDLRDTVISIRMQPVSLLFTPFKRFVHDFSREMGKKAVLEIRGGDTELDKTVLERLNDPLLHILRNCLDHGIEYPEQRRQTGKTDTGRIIMAAEHAGSQVLIQISDDGNGINMDAVRRRAEEAGFLDGSRKDGRQPLSDEALLECIFSPGFSTAEEVSNISGRGVGMDAVRERIEELGGDIRLATKAGQGATVTLQIPITLAIIDGLQIRVGTTHYIVPMADVTEVMEISREGEEGDHLRNVIGVRDELVPWIRLEELFRLPPTQKSDISYLVIMGRKDERVGFLVDEVVGEHQTVIRPLQGLMRHSRVFSGSTILSDGAVSLILDIRRITGVAEAEALVYNNRTAYDDHKGPVSGQRPERVRQ